jgi:peroxiredoxin
VLQPADKAPDFELPLLTGGTWWLAEALRERSVLLAFFKISCPTCQLAFPFLQRLADSAHKDAPRLVAISQDNVSDTTYFQQRFGVSMPTLIEDSRTWGTSNAYQIASVPSLFLIAQDGTISRSSEGFHRAELEKLAELFAVPIFGPEDHVPAVKPG